MTNMNTADFLNAVDHAAGMNDRWLFLAAFCLLLLVCGVVIYWLVQQLQAVIADHKALARRTSRGAHPNHRKAKRNIAQAGGVH